MPLLFSAGQFIEVSEDYASGMRILTLLIVLLCTGAAAQDLADTDLESFRFMQAERKSWKKHFDRDPAYIEELRRVAKAKTDDGYRFIEAGKTIDRRETAHRLLNSYYLSYDLSEFKVLFPTRDDAVLTFKAVATGHAGGRTKTKAAVVRGTYKRSDGKWVSVSTVMIPSN